MTTTAMASAQSRWLPYYLALVVTTSLTVGVSSWFLLPRPSFGPLVLLCIMGLVSYQIREPELGLRISFSFLSIILVASAAIVGMFGAWLVGALSMLVDREQPRRSVTMFNAAMCSLLGASSALTYALLGGVEGDAMVGMGPVRLASDVGWPLLAADIAACLVNAALLSGVISLDKRVPFWVQMRQVLTGSGVAYVGYGVIGLLFVILWFPAGLGAFSALLVLAPLLAARWAFIQFGEELRSHERTVDTLVTALGTKEPAAVGRSRRAAALAEWVAEGLGLPPGQIGTVRYAATLHEIGHLGVATRLLRRAPSSLSPAERRVIDGHSVVGARMIEGIDFLEDARSGIRHQHERFDGSGRPDGRAGQDIPIAARIVAVTSAIDEVVHASDAGAGVTVADVARALSADPGRFDPDVVAAAIAALDRHGLPTSAPAEAAT
ncbi:metal-dependent phosphohydrolase [Terrabacter sp. Root85]|uniref:HD-GYP domain-containing protein n=1 Tax=Terrabacter sp. Root85 TaxID=1736603 RepID=UPI0006F4B0A8|nr:HD domain-containing phosphohydrolase [Terrabacter sp. Root85]KRC89271.1 metal-dependent phosphohydrolase [Terrabacter sp. Root85]